MNSHELWTYNKIIVLPTAMDTCQTHVRIVMHQLSRTKYYVLAYSLWDLESVYEVSTDPPENSIRHLTYLFLR